MKKKLFIFAAILAGIGLIAGTFVYIFVYNKPHTDYSKASPDYVLNAAELFEEYRTNPDVSAKKYNGKVLVVTGDLNAVEQPDSLTIAVFGFEEGLFGSEGVRCTMIPEHAGELINTAPGTNLSIKGFCTGYNDSDVILEHCSISNNTRETP